MTFRARQFHLAWSFDGQNVRAAIDREVGSGQPHVAAGETDVALDGQVRQRGLRPADQHPRGNFSAEEPDLLDRLAGRRLEQ